MSVSFRVGVSSPLDTDRVTMLKSQSFRVWFGTMLLMCAVFCGVAFGAQLKNRSVAPQVANYRIVVGDVLQVTVYHHQDLSRKVVVRYDGNITLPSIDDVKAAGLTATGLATLLHDRLEPIVPDPQVRVTVVIHAHPPVQPTPEPTPQDTVSSAR